MRDCCRRSGHRTISAARANAHDDAFRLSIAAAKNEVLCFGNTLKKIRVLATGSSV